MQYPLISEYVAAIKNAADNLDKLQGLQPVFDDYGEPVHSSGAFAVVFKMVDENGKFYALKCFTEEQTGRAEAYKMIAEELEIVNSSYMMKVEYYDKELFVDSNITEDTEFPVLLMDWIEGVTMDVFIADNYKDEYEMSWLCYRFCKMAAWLRSQPFAHGDIKPDNIIVKDDGELVLIDYDGMYVPAMKGQKSPTLGTKDFVHPNRKIEDFDESIDDFTLASIALSLKAISLDSSLYDKYAAPDRLLFSAEDYSSIAKCKLMKELCELMGDAESVKLKELFENVWALGNLSSVNPRLFVVEKPSLEKTVEYTQEELEEMAKVTQEELDSIEWDETGAKYSSDGKRLLKVKADVIGTFIVKDGTCVICSVAFRGNNIKGIRAYIPINATGCSITGLIIPSSVLFVPEGVLAPKNKVQNIVVDANNPRYTCNDDCNVIVDKVTNRLVVGCNNSIIPEFVNSIGKMAFYNCSKLSSLTLPPNLSEIGYYAFYGCHKLESIDIPQKVTDIKPCAFAGCSSLTSIVIPHNIKVISSGTFRWCSNLSKVALPDGLTTIEGEAFLYCKDLKSIEIPSSVVCIGYDAIGNDVKKIRIAKGTKSRFMQLLPDYLHRILVECRDVL